ncbi:MAG: hypothetical protein A4E71_01369 [Smithella sp. PtaU1.Bin162]|nr:MAG: hypothetical protein A4E71_01369 [Smithella sp. PtaU1.Bin162]
MNVGVICHLMSQKTSPVKPFIEIGVESDFILRSAETGKERGKPGKKFQIDYRVQFSFSCPKEEFQRVRNKYRHTIFPDCENVFLGNSFQQIQAGLVFFENGKMDIGIDFLLQFSHRRIN